LIFKKTTEEKIKNQKAKSKNAEKDRIKQTLFNIFAFYFVFLIFTF